MAELALTMPKMSMTMEEGTMVTWLKEIGDSVRAGEPICEVTTDKVDMEVECPYEGVLARIVANEDDVIKVGEPIGFITTDADDLLGGLFDEPLVDAPRVVVPFEESAADAALPSTTSTDWPAAVPLARTVAAERGIDLARVSGTGPWGTIRVSDVEAHDSPATHAATLAPAWVTEASTAPTLALAVASAPDAADEPWASRKRRTRSQVAKVMSASAAVPQFTAFLELDFSALSPIRKTMLGGASWTAILVRAQALALAAHPQLNAYWVEGAAIPNSDIGIALAVDSPAGLLAPVLKNPNLGTLAELAAELGSLVDDARRGIIAPARLVGGTSVFSNLGGFGVESFNALLTPPQATALSSGAIRNKIVVVDDGAIGVRLSCTVGLTVDHRVADGADAARYLSTLREIIADRSALLG